MQNLKYDKKKAKELKGYVQKNIKDKNLCHKPLKHSCDDKCTPRQFWTCWLRHNPNLKKIKTDENVKNEPKENDQKIEQNVENAKMENGDVMKDDPNEVKQTEQKSVEAEAHQPPEAEVKTEIEATSEPEKVAEISTATPPANMTAKKKTEIGVIMGPILISWEEETK